MIRITAAGSEPYPIDCALTERVKYEADITENTVESGGAISDNIRPKLPVVEFEGIVSDTPIGAVALHPSRTQTVDGAKPKPSRDAYDRFVAIHEGREPVTVECSYGKFDTMALESLTTDKDPKSAKAFKFTATFRKIRIVTNNRTTVRIAIPLPGGGTASSPGKRVDLGHRTSKIWGDKLGLKDAEIFVVCYPTNVRNTLAQSLGAPITTRKALAGESAPEYDCYEVRDGTVPDGYLTKKSGLDDPTVAHEKGGSNYFYTPINARPTSYIGQDTHHDADEKVPPKPAGAAFYNYGKKQWVDKNGDPITQRPPPPQNWRNVLWGRR